MYVVRFLLSKIAGFNWPVESVISSFLCFLRLFFSLLVVEASLHGVPQKKRCTLNLVCVYSQNLHLIAFDNVPNTKNQRNLEHDNKFLLQLDICFCYYDFLGL